MAPLLYLDTARLGQMTPAAKDAQLDFVRLSAEEPSSLYFEQFLRDGFSAWPSCYQHRFHGIRHWQGVAGLKRSLRTLVGAGDDWNVLLASRSLALVRLAARSLFGVCSNVLAADLSWPTYRQVLQHRAHRRGKWLTIVALRHEILRQRWSVEDVASYLATAFDHHHCDGLFLPAVDHLGIRLPIRAIVERIRRRGELRYCLIDAAQALCQVPLDEVLAVADFVVAGSHKWMGAYFPAGIGFVPPKWSGKFAPHSTCRHQHDPLMTFTEQLDGGRLDTHSETADVSPLIACAGAVVDRSRVINSTESQMFESRLQAVPLPHGKWNLLAPISAMRSRIALLQRAGGQWSADELRSQWLQAGAVISAFPPNLARISFAADSQSQLG